jgi:hypothetical protein
MTPKQAVGHHVSLVKIPQQASKQKQYILDKRGE